MHQSIAKTSRNTSIFTREEERFSDRVYVSWANAIARPIEENFIFIRRYIDPGPRMVILDAGCGPGVISRELLRWGSVVGIDISRGILAVAKGTQQNASFVRADLLALPLRPGSIDIIVFWDTLHHLADPEQVILDSFRVLKNRGCVFAFEPNVHSYQSVLFKCLYRDNIKSPNERPLSPFRLKRDFLASGFSDVVVHVIGLVPQRLYEKLGRRVSRVCCMLNWAFSDIPLFSMLGGRMCIYGVKKPKNARALLRD